MWSSSGLKITGKYGTWNGQEVELHSTAPVDGMLLLVKYGGQAPGPEWMTIDLGNRFPISGIRHALEVPADEVSNIHAVTTTGELGSRGTVTILAEARDGRLAASANDLGLKEWLIMECGFHTYFDEPVTRSSAFGWLPAALVSNIKSSVSWRKDNDS